jgi:hypothetical protein
MARIDRFVTQPIRRSGVSPSTFRTRDHTIRTFQTPLQSSDHVLLLSGHCVSPPRSGVVDPKNGDAYINMVDFRRKIGKSAWNLPPKHASQTLGFPITSCDGGNRAAFFSSQYGARGHAICFSPSAACHAWGM